jgi:zinc-binding in reverse transcriptase
MSFTTADTYKFLHESPHIQVQHGQLWKLKAPPRVQIFLWLATRNRILTIDNLVRTGWQLPNMCYLCRAHQESVQHIFHQCSFTTQVRDYMTSTLPNQPPRYYVTGSTMDSLLMNQDSMEWKRVDATTIYVIWRERCRHIFAQKAQDIIQTAREIYSELKSWFDRNKDLGATRSSTGNQTMVLPPG